MKRNCSLAPRQLVLAYLLLCIASLLVALFFTVRGAWYVLGFSFLELSAVGWAFCHYARHATDQEHIALADGRLLVELVQAGKISRFWLDASRTRIALPTSRRGLIALEADGLQVEVGQFLMEWKRCEFAQELRGALTFDS